MALGYDPDFLTHNVPLPTLTAQVASDAVEVDGSTVVDHTHFSLKMSASRGFARWVAWNVDGAAMQKLSRSSMRFRYDPKVPERYQVGDELYSDNRIDRGHLARRADLTWGEDAVYEEVEVQHLRISVLGGPVLADGDQVYRGVALPKEFWKVVIFVEHDTLKARAFLLTQSLDRLEILALDEFRAYQVRLDILTARTGIDFGDALSAAATLPQGIRVSREPLESVADIRW